MQHKVNIILCGTGTVGGTLLQQIASQQRLLKEQHRMDLQVVGIVDIFNIMTDEKGIDLSGFEMNKFREDFKQCPKSSLSVIHDAVLEMRKAIKDEELAFIDCTASYEIADLYQDFIDAGVSIVCANKVAASGPYDRYRKLKDTAVKNNVKYLYETNVGAGLPIIQTMQHLVMSGDKITKIEAVLSGTLNYIFNTISDDVTFSQAVKGAKEARFAEPDPRIDLSGIDVIRKLVILARESGYQVEQDDVEKHLFMPD